jgi:hypothetical protein
MKRLAAKGLRLECSKRASSNSYKTNRLSNYPKRHQRNLQKGRATVDEREKELTVIRIRYLLIDSKFDTLSAFKYLRLVVICHCRLFVFFSKNIADFLSAMANGELFTKIKAKIIST